ncbi:hypothetical protein LJR290_005847 [Variovorax sp. LjRoot290]|uniref:hypothetical protein n=1 Tax=unclassified Variovorax TaxID=663243 RepID=UPI00147B3CA8|nr:hypothetical protein [Variovorax sp. CF079]
MALYRGEGPYCERIHEAALVNFGFPWRRDRAIPSQPGSSSGDSVTGECGKRF